VTASVSGNGSVTMNGCQDTFGHAYTYVYVSSPRTISVPLANGSDVDACVWREDSSGTQNMGTGASVPLQAGWSILHVTGYHQHQGWGPLWINASLTSQVDIVSPSQFIKPQLAGDADGNGITDLITFNATSGTWTVSCSRSCAFSPSSSWLTGFGNTSSTPLLGDWNGDGRTDIAIYNGGSWQFATSTGTSFQTGTVASASFGGGTPLTGDFNGDGFIDAGTYNDGAWQIALGNGSGFSPAGSFAMSWGTSGHEPLTGGRGDLHPAVGFLREATREVRVFLDRHLREQGAQRRVPNAVACEAGGCDGPVVERDGHQVGDAMIRRLPGLRIPFLGLGCRAAHGGTIAPDAEGGNL